MKDVWKQENLIGVKKINKKKIVITIIIVILAVASIVIGGLYMSNKQIREWIDKNIFRKEVEQDTAITIELNEGQTGNIYAFNRYIGILNQTRFTIYGNTGNEETSLDIQISNPIFNSANRFLAIAENGGQKFYLITDKSISWEEEVDGNISQIYVNKNGYVAVVISGTSYKTVVKMYTPEGKEMFTTFLASTRATMIQSYIRIMSIEKAEKDPTNAKEKTYTSEAGRLITNVKYQNRNKLVCMYTDMLTEIENDQENVLVDSKDKKIIFQSVELENNASYVEEKSSGLFTADSIVSIVNIDTKETKQYTVNYVAKEIYTYGNIIALNLGTEIEFINTGGWLVKRYIANQEITSVVVSDVIAGIIYRDKIEIINL